MKKILLSALMLMLAVITLFACGDSAAKGKPYFGTYASASGTDSVVIDAKNFKWGDKSYTYGYVDNKITVAGNFAGGKTSVDFQIFEDNQILSIGILVNFSSGTVFNRNGSLDVNLIDYSADLSVISACSLRNDNTFINVYPNDLTLNCRGKYTLKNGLLHFVGVYTVSNKPYNEYWYITENFDVHWQPYVKDINLFKPNQENPSDTFDLTYSADIGGTITGNLNQTVKQGANGNQVTAVANEGYEFIDWSDGVTTAVRQDNNIQENLAVTARFEVKQPDSYTLSYNAQDGGSIQGKTLQNVEQGADGNQVTAIASDGYEFIDWSDGVTTAVRQDNNIQENLVVTARFEVKQPETTVTYDYGFMHGGSSTSTFKAKKGENINLIVLNRDGYVFEGWFYGGTKICDGIWQYDYDMTIYAKWKVIEHTITYNIDGGSIEKLKTKFTIEDLPLVLQIPDKENMNFIGWYTTQNFDENSEVDTIDQKQDFTLFAKYEDSAAALKYGYNEADDSYFVSAFTGNAKKVTIPSVHKGKSVTAIGDNAFSGCRSLTSITLPVGVTSIGNSAFRGCDSLTSITLPVGVTSIGGWAFSSCGSLTSITIPVGVTSIGEWAFANCGSLTSITLPVGVTSIGTSAFYNCDSLTSITLPNTITHIGYSTFHGCRSLTSVTLPTNVTIIDSEAFRGCISLTSITIPASVISIGNEAFNNCPKLATVYIDSLTIANEINATSHGDLFKFATTIYIKDDLVFSNSYISNVFTLIGNETVNDIEYKKYIL